MDNSKTKRPRPVLSCWQCRSRKLKCNRQKPCEQCVRAARPNECTFPSEQDRVAATFHTTDAESTPEHDQIDQLPTKRARLITPEENHSARSKIEGGIGVIEDLQLRVRALEDRLSHHASTGNRDATFVQPLSRLSDGLKSLTGLEADGYRFRYRGQHHRATILKLFGEVKPFVHKAVRDPKVGSVIRDASQVQKSYAKKYNSYSAQPIPDISSAIAHMIELFPTRFVCDMLVDIYFTHWEKTLRVVHVPSFRREYDAFWERNDHPPSPVSPGFVPQLLAMLVIAYRMHSDSQAIIKRGFAYNCYAMLKAWQNQLTGKERSYFSNLQAVTLSVIAGQMIPQPLDKMWTETGILVRHAMTLGLHVEPDAYAKVNAFHGEVRRRLWATILELDIQSALLASMPTTIRASDYSTRSPLNIDDGDLSHDMERLPNPQPDGYWTDTLPQTFLANSAQWRLQAAEALSQQQIPDGKDDLSHIASKLIEACRNRSPPLELDIESLARFEHPDRLASLVLLDLFTRRALISAYRPRVLSKGWNADLAARRQFVASSLQILECQDALDPEIKDVDAVNTKSAWALLQNLGKHDIVQAALGICFEVKCMNESLSTADGKDPSSLWLHTVSAEVDVSFQPSTLKSKAFMVRSVKNTVDLMIRGIADHGNDIKDILLLAVVLQSIKTNAPEADKHAAMMEDLAHVINTCRQRLQTESGPNESTDGPYKLSLHNLPSVPAGTSATSLGEDSADYSMAPNLDFSSLDGFLNFDDLDFDFPGQWQINTV